MKTETYKCPNCGAILDADVLQPVQQCKCGYCGTIVTFKDEDYSSYMAAHRALESMQRDEETEKILFFMNNGNLDTAYEIADAYRQEHITDPFGYKACLAIVCMCDLGEDKDDIKEVEDMIKEEWLLFKDACFGDEDYATFAKLVCDFQSCIKRRKILRVLSKIISPILIIAGIMLTLLGTGYIIAASILGASAGGFVISVFAVIFGIILFVGRYILRNKIYLIENLLDKFKHKE